MRSLALLPIALASLLLGGGVASASPYRARSSAHTQRLDPISEQLEVPVTLELPSFRSTFEESTSSFELRMEELAPEALELRLDLHPVVTVYLAADLDDELPRLDALDGDTYFVVGVELHVTRTVRLFAEDFQPASMVVGDPKELEFEPPPLRSWDGHQVGLGVKWEPLAQIRIEASAVFHVLSATGRSSSTGARLNVTFAF